MASGVEMDSEGVNFYNDHFHLKKKDQNMFIVYYIKDGFIRLDKDLQSKTTKTVNKDPTPEEFLRAHKEMMASCPDDDCRFIVFNYQRGDRTNVEEESKGAKKSQEGKQKPKDRIICIMWSPENAPIKQKMTYASSKGAIQKGLTGVKHFEIFDRNDLSIESLDAMVS